MPPLPCSRCRGRTACTWRDRPPRPSPWVPTHSASTGPAPTWTLFLREQASSICVFEFFSFSVRRRSRAITCLFREYSRAAGLGDRSDNIYFHSLLFVFNVRNVHSQLFLMSPEKVDIMNVYLVSRDQSILPSKPSTHGYVGYDLP